jgi:hypothetical protein
MHLHSFLYKFVCTERKTSLVLCAIPYLHLPRHFQVSRKLSDFATDTKEMRDFWFLLRWWKDSSLPGCYNIPIGKVLPRSNWLCLLHVTAVRLMCTSLSSEPNIIFGLFDIEDKGTKIPRNVGKYSLVDTA